MSATSDTARPMPAPRRSFGNRCLTLGAKEATRLTRQVVPITKPRTSAMRPLHCKAGDIPAQANKLPISL